VGEDDLFLGPLDVDFFPLRPSASGVLEVRVRSFGDPAIRGPDRVDTLLRLWSPTGELLAENDDAAGFDPLLQFPVEAGRVYYAAVSGFPNFAYDPLRWSSGVPSDDLGDYTLAARVLPEAKARELSDNSLTAGTPRRLALNERLSAEVGRDESFSFASFGSRPEDDIDLYEVIAPETGVLEVEPEAGLERSTLVAVRVFDALGQELPPGAFELLAGPHGDILGVSVVPGDRYYLGVTAEGDDDRAYSARTGKAVDGAAFTNRGAYGGRYGLVVKEFFTRPFRVPPGQRRPPPPAAAGPEEVTPLVRITRGKVKRKGKRARQTVLLNNASGRTLVGPLFVVVEGLSRKRARLRGVSGFWPAGGTSPYVLAALPGNVLAPGATAAVSLSFVVKAGRSPQYGLRLFAVGA
jgi:hypothetical protein